MHDARICECATRVVVELSWHSQRIASEEPLLPHIELEVQMRRVVHVLTVLSLGGFFLACSDSSAGAPDTAAESDAGETRDSATTPDTGKPVSDAGAAPDATHASDSAVPHDGGAVNQGPTKVNVRFGACNAPAPCGGVRQEHSRSATLASTLTQRSRQSWPRVRR